MRLCLKETKPKIVHGTMHTTFMVTTPCREWVAIYIDIFFGYTFSLLSRELLSCFLEALNLASTQTHFTSVIKESAVYTGYVHRWRSEKIDIKRVFAS